MLLWAARARVEAEDWPMRLYGDYELTKLMDQLDTLLELRGTTEDSFVPAAQGRLLDLAINALKMCVQASLEKRREELPKEVDLLLAYAEEAYKNPVAKKEYLDMAFDCINAEGRFMQKRAQHLLGLTPYAAIMSKKPIAPNYGELANRAVKEAQWAVRGVRTINAHLFLENKLDGDLSP
jgi:hypothetical protein